MFNVAVMEPDLGASDPVAPRELNVEGPRFELDQQLLCSRVAGDLVPRRVHLQRRVVVMGKSEGPVGDGAADVQVDLVSSSRLPELDVAEA